MFNCHNDYIITFLYDFSQTLSTNMQMLKSPVITNMMTNVPERLPQNSMIPSIIPKNTSTNSNIFNFENLD
ncbi:unnamed protein product [Schistosoma rodhaini]|nr:unnamed protein product [Schistosoma rodhaini]